MSHTPGSWKIAGKSSNDGEAFVIESESRTIGWTCNTLNETDEEVITEEDKANAQLIATAPDLLEALKECITDDGASAMKEGLGRSRRRLLAINEIAKAAIAKAEGNIE